VICAGKAVLSHYIGRLHQCKLSVQIGTANPAEARVIAEKGGYTQVLHTHNASPVMLTCLSALCAEAGLRRKPFFLLNPYNAAASGLTFGRFRRSYVVLNSGLVLLFSLDQPAFRAVVLHELGHVRNADIDKTYLTITVGWAFVIAALIPWIVMQFFLPQDFGTTLSIAWRILILSIVIYFTRNAILRAREVYADVRASVWDEQDGQTRQSGQTGALRRVINSLPAVGKGRWRYLFRTHPDPQKRNRLLDDTAALFSVRFWDAFAVGIVVITGISGVNYLLSLWENEFRISLGQTTEPGWAVATGILAALMIAGIVGLGIWRATFASLFGGVTPRALQTSVALVLGLLLGQALSISSVFTNFIAGVPSLLPGSWTPSTLIGQVTFFLLWDVLLLLMLFLLLCWLKACTATWLNVAMRGSSPGQTYWIALVLATVILGIWFVQISAIQLAVQVILDPSNPLHTTMIDVLVSALLFAWYELGTEPLICLTYVCIWAYPLALWLWRTQRSGIGNTTWVSLDASPQTRQQVVPAQVSMHLGLALIVGLAGGLAFCMLLLLITFAFHLPLSNDETIVLAALVQAGVAALVAGRVEQLGVIQGLFTAFVAGCVMTAGIVVYSLLYPEHINFPTPWSVFLQVINGGALASLLVTLVVSLLAIGIRRLNRPVSRSHAA
jgi:hypothetical protein